tara:strand:- start:745 stop:918 length:174 start_codon:yes stop_codon:yes gene_type:complete
MGDTGASGDQNNAQTLLKNDHMAQAGDRRDGVGQTYFFVPYDYIFFSSSVYLLFFMY